MKFALFSIPCSDFRIYLASTPTIPKAIEQTHVSKNGVGLCRCYNSPRRIEFILILLSHYSFMTQSQQESESLILPHARQTCNPLQLQQLPEGVPQNLQPQPQLRQKFIQGPPQHKKDKTHKITKQRDRKKQRSEGRSRVRQEQQQGRSEWLQQAQIYEQFAPDISQGQNRTQQQGQPSEQGQSEEGS